MPELPDVEARKRLIEVYALNKRIKKVTVRDGRIVEFPSPTLFARRLRDSRFASVKRRGKYALVMTDNGNTLLLHFGMTGNIFYKRKGEPVPEYSRLEFCFEDGSCLHYTNMRMIGKAALYGTSNPSEIEEVAKLGPEPLDRKFTFARFKEALSGTNINIHQALMDQERIAGIGNIYSDEITFQAGIRPDRAVSSLSEEELRKVYDNMKRTLRRAIELNAELDGHADRFIIPNRKKGGNCPKCGVLLLTLKIGGRTSYYCPKCQG